MYTIRQKLQVVLPLKRTVSLFFSPFPSQPNPKQQIVWIPDKNSHTKSICDLSCLGNVIITLKNVQSASNTSSERPALPSTSNLFWINGLKKTINQMIKQEALNLQTIKRLTCATRSKQRTREILHWVQGFKILFGATLQNVQSQALSKDYTDEKVKRYVYFQVG